MRVVVRESDAAIADEGVIIPNHDAELEPCSRRVRLDRRELGEKVARFIQRPRPPHLVLGHFGIGPVGMNDGRVVGREPAKCQAIGLDGGKHSVYIISTKLRVPHRSRWM